MTPSHLHLCILCACIPPSLPKCKFQRTCDQILCAKRSFQHSDREGRKKKVSGERWAARRSHVTHIGALPAVSMCPDRCHQISLPRFWAKVNGRLLGGFRKAAPRSSKNLQEIWGKGKQQDLNEFTWLWKVKNSTFPNVGNRKTPPFRAGGKSDPLGINSPRHHVNLIWVNDITSIFRQSQGTNLKFFSTSRIVTPHWTSVHWFDQKSILFWWPHGGF